MLKTLYIKLNPANKISDQFVQVIVAEKKTDLESGGTFATLMKGRSSSEFLIKLSDAITKREAIEVEINTTEFKGEGYDTPTVNTWINEPQTKSFVDNVLGITSEEKKLVKKDGKWEVEVA